MPEVRLTVSVPEDSWIHELSTAYPVATFHVVTVVGGTETAIVLFEVVTSDVVPVLTTLASDDAVTDVELLWKQNDRALVQVETANPLLLGALLRAGVALKTPFELQNGTATWDLSTSSGRLSQLSTQLDATGIDYTVEYVREFGSNEADTLLTDRQRQLFHDAVLGGYYDTPRRTTVTELADEAGIAKSTASDLLHRAEGAIARWFFDEYLTAAADASPTVSEHRRA